MKEEKETKKETKKKNYFEELNSINVSDKTEQKNGLTYLSWAWAWGEVKKLYPDANYKIYETETGCIYWTDGKTAWVKTGVTINNIEHIEYLPVMDYKNKSILIENITSFDVNKAIQRSLTKAVARHGLGLYIYAGEDLPEDNKKELETLREKIKSYPNAIEVMKKINKKLSECNEEELKKIISYLEKESKKGDDDLSTK
jgi:hypothetical protein